jgi:hypothetical protein
MEHSSYSLSFPDVQLHIGDAPLGADLESKFPIVVMDSGLARKGLAPRNDSLLGSASLSRGTGGNGLAVDASLRTSWASHS